MISDDDAGHIVGRIAIAQLLDKCTVAHIIGLADIDQVIAPVRRYTTGLVAACVAGFGERGLQAMNIRKYRSLD